MKKKKKKKYIFISLVGIFLIILIFYVTNNRIIILDNLKSLTSSILITDNNEISKEIINTEIEDLNREISDLKELHDTGKLLSDKKIINASIFKRSNNYWFNILTINKGSKNGIKKGDSVISNDGLIGEVIIVNKNSSEVKLLTSTRDNYISAKFIVEDKEYFGIIKKYDVINNLLVMENVIGDINKKDINVMTSGLSNNFPSGLYIGKIFDIKKDKYNLSNTVYITPGVNFNNINLVKVIKND